MSSCRLALQAFDQARRSREIRDHMVRAGRDLGAALWVVTDQQSHRPDATAKLDVARLVTDHDRISGIKFEIESRVEQQLGAGFAAGTTVLGSVRTAIDASQIGAGGADHLQQPGIDLLQPPKGKKTAANAGLVTDHDQSEAVLMQLTHPLGSARTKFESVGIVQIIPIEHQSAIAVEHYHAGVRAPVAA